MVTRLTSLPTGSLRAERSSLARLYFVYFLFYGAWLPYLNLHFRHLGLSGTQIGILTSLRPICATLVPPLVGYVADRRGSRRRCLAWVLLGGVVPFYLVLGASSFWWLMLCMLLFSAFTSPVIPMLDANAIDVLDGDRARYGLMRRWGSLGYLVAVIIGGRLTERLALDRLLAISGLFALTAGLLAWRFSRGDRPILSQLATAGSWWRGPVRSWREIVRLPGMPSFLLAGFLGWTASATYYTFFSIYAEELGMSGRLIGLAWGVGVASEIAVLSLTARLLTRLPAKRLFAFGLATASLRWFLYATVTHPYAILGLQTMHGFTFGASQAGAVNHLASQAAGKHRTSVQTLWGAVTGGVAGVASSLFLAPLSDLFGLRLLFGLSGLLSLMGAGVVWLEGWHVHRPS